MIPMTARIHIHLVAVALPSVEKPALLALELSISPIIGEKQTDVGKANYLSCQLLAAIPLRSRGDFPSRFGELRSFYRLNLAKLRSNQS